MSVRGLRSYVIYFMRNVAMEQSIPTVKIIYSMHESEFEWERELGYIEVFFQIISCFFRVLTSTFCTYPDLYQQFQILRLLYCYWRYKADLVTSSIFAISERLKAIWTLQNFLQVTIVKCFESNIFQF